MGIKVLKVIGKSALMTISGILMVADGIMVRDLMWMKIDERVKKNAEKKAAKEAKKAQKAA